MTIERTPTNERRATPRVVRPREYAVEVDRTPSNQERRTPRMMRPRGAYSDPSLPPDLRNEVDVKSPENPAGRHKAPGPKRGHGGGHHGRHHHHHSHHYGCGHYGYGYYGYDPFYGYSPYYYGYSPYYYGTPYFGTRTYYRANEYGSGGGGGSRYGDGGLGGLDVDVRPDKAEVWIDGSYVGVADQYDGFPTYLWLEEGTYEIAFYLEGHETIFRQYTIYPGVIIDVDDRMREGQSIHPEAPLLEPPPGSQSGLPTGPPAAWSVGRIVISASPPDAAIYLDGHFVGTAQEVTSLTSGLLVEPGDHVIEIVRPGFDTQSAPVSIEAGGRVDLQLGLEKP
ncbi:MAG: PEGA domain-containing protein [bacterium]|nr:PEGA domain-containing protein [bacterium]